jgi:hypothetical protein
LKNTLTGPLILLKIKTQMKRLLFPLLVLFNLNVDAQSNLDFLDLFDGYIDYRIPVNNGINTSNHGTSGEIAFTFSELFSETAWLSLYVGRAYGDKLWRTQFDTDFAADFEDLNSIADFSGQELSGLIRLQDDFYNLKEWDVPLPSYHNGFHEKTLYCGIILAPPNARLPALKIYTGITNTVGGIDRECTTGGENGFHRIKRPLRLGVNICQRDLLSVFDSSIESPVSLSVYFEFNDFSKATYS